MAWEKSSHNAAQLIQHVGYHRHTLKPCPRVYWYFWKRYLYLNRMKFTWACGVIPDLDRPCFYLCLSLFKKITGWITYCFCVLFFFFGGGVGGGKNKQCTLVCQYNFSWLICLEIISVATVQVARVEHVTLLTHAVESCNNAISGSCASRFSVLSVWRKLSDFLCR